MCDSTLMKRKHAQLFAYLPGLSSAYACSESRWSELGFVSLIQAYGIIGCVRFLECYYLMLITKREQQGCICGHKVYSVSDTALIPLVEPSSQVRE